MHLHDACLFSTSVVWKFIDANVTGIVYLMDQRKRKTLLAQVERQQPELPSVPDSSQLAYIYQDSLNGNVTPDQSTKSICLLEDQTQSILHLWHKLQWGQNCGGSTQDYSIRHYSAKFVQASNSGKNTFWRQRCWGGRINRVFVFKLTNC